METLYDKMVADGTYTSPLEQAPIEQAEADTLEAKSRMLILNKKTTQLNAAQKIELKRHTELGGSHSIKPYCSSDIPDFSYKSLNTPDTAGV